MNSRLVAVVGWIGSALGLAGSLVLALNTSYSGYGFLAYLGSNFALYHGVKTRTWALVVMQIGFTVTSVLGLRNWVF
ncbi:hypothetical protein A1353_23175 [Methylomonas methanica]|uniref:Uncharacterized protein n=2 Tax=Methylomonas methanica TaxID=421 RepID=A0A177LV19_METMH|nr:hypothetical protein A1353_23175 [Methylomonas methanica]